MHFIGVECTCKMAGHIYYANHIYMYSLFFGNHTIGVNVCPWCVQAIPLLLRLVDHTHLFYHFCCRWCLPLTLTGEGKAASAVG